FWIAAGAVGVPVPLAGAALAFGLAGLAGGLLLMPAGVGAVEGSLVATVAALGGDPAGALAAAVLARCLTLWVWVPPGLWLAFRASWPMLRAAARRGVGQVVQADAFALPLAPGACDAVVSLRLLFHFADPAPLLRELRRITRPGGRLVCDTSTWSPRSALPL